MQAWGLLLLGTPWLQLATAGWPWAGEGRLRATVGRGRRPIGRPGEQPPAVEGGALCFLRGMDEGVGGSSADWLPLQRELKGGGWDPGAVREAGVLFLGHFPQVLVVAPHHGGQELGRVLVPGPQAESGSALLKRPLLGCPCPLPPCGPCGSSCTLDSHDFPAGHSPRNPGFRFLPCWLSFGLPEEVVGSFL